MSRYGATELTVRAGEPDDPLISICIPTHHGRCEVLAELLADVIDQAQEVPGLVEVCVSDNASRDGTEELLTRLSGEGGCRVTYQRQSEDTGLARNLLASVELARGRYCWLLGSDDLLAAGALRRVCRLLGEFPDATGYVVGATHVDAEDPGLRSRALPRAFHPPFEYPRLIEGLERVYDECGNSWCALSWTLVDRAMWLGVARSRRERVLEHPIFPQVVVLGSLTAERPVWACTPEPLVRQRNATTFLFEHGGVSLADRWSQIIGGAASAWAAVLGGRARARWRRRMRLLHRVWGSAEDVRATKLYDRPSVRSQARLALILLGAFWPVRDYWRRVLAVSLTPVWLTCLLHGPASKARRAEKAELVLSASLPDRMIAGGVAHVELAVRNVGRRAIRSEGSQAVTIGQRWWAPGREHVGQDRLALNDLAAMPQSLPGSVRVDREGRTELALYAPIAPGHYSVELLAHQNGQGWLDDVRALRADVEVVDMRSAAQAPVG